MHRLLLAGIAGAGMALSAMAADIHDDVAGGHLESVKKALEADPALLAEPDEDQNLPLHIAAIHGHAKLAALLVDAGADVDAEDREGSTPLEVAASHGHAKLAALLIERGADVDHQDVNGLSAMHFAAYAGHADTVRVLLKAGADPSLAKPNGSMPIHGASLGGHRETVDLLLDHGVDIEVANEAGYRPLHDAIAGLEWALASHLLERGADPNAPLADGQYPLLIAAWGDPPLDLFEYLIKSGADVRAEWHGWTPLHAAARTEKPELVELLLSKGADPETPNVNGDTPFDLAIRTANCKTVAQMIKAGADIDRTAGESARAPLHWAALKGCPELTALLLRAGASPEVRDGGGRTPMDLASRYAHPGVVDVLAAGGVDRVEADAPRSSARLLATDLDEGEAAMWYLGNCGWAVRTANNFLIFDYWSPEGESPDACLANGGICPDEIADQHVTVLVTHEHGDHYDPAIFRWADEHEDIAYVYGFRPQDLPEGSVGAGMGADYAGPDYIHVGPRQTRSVNGLDISTIRANDAGVGYLVKVDGVTIYHAGDHAGWADGERDGYFAEIDHLATLTDSVDLAMINVTGCHAHDPERLREGAAYTVRTLGPNVVVPTHGHEREHVYRQAEREARQVGIANDYCCPECAGDHYLYSSATVRQLH
jgi:ankyrin repeat protein/L-ascorbate metabolism protein UlaG (beta-lactamase superfamily)